VTNLTARGPLNGYHTQITTNANTPSGSRWISANRGGLLRPVVSRRPMIGNLTPGFSFRYDSRSSAPPASTFPTPAPGRSHRLRRAQPGTNAPVYRFSPATARFVRLTTIRLPKRDSNNYAFALTELRVLDADQNVAQGSQVTALDSIETGAWAQVNLTDGVTVTVRPTGGGGALPATLGRKSFMLPGPIRRANSLRHCVGLYELT